MKQRYQLIDALRGLSITLMVGYHIGYLLIEQNMASYRLIDNDLLNTLQPIFAGIFILLSGMSCYFSRSNLKRGAKTWVCAVIVTVVMALAGYPVWFGILHFLGTAMLIYGLMQKWRLTHITKWQHGLYVLSFVVLYEYFPIHVKFTDWLMPFGFYHTWGHDYFPLLPWIFLFLFGTWLGQLVTEQKLPQWFYAFKMPVLPYIGRHTLIIYMAHMPVAIGVVELLKICFEL